MHAFMAIVLAATVTSGGMLCKPEEVLFDHPNYFQYQVGFFRKHWRTDYLYHTVIAGQDTLARDLTISGMTEFVMSTDLPDTAEVTLVMTIMRYEHARDGNVRNVYPVYNFDLEKIQRLERQQRARRDRPTAAVTR